LSFAQARSQGLSRFMASRLSHRNGARNGWSCKASPQR